MIQTAFTVKRKPVPCLAIHKIKGKAEKVQILGYLVDGFPIGLYINKETRVLCHAKSGLSFGSLLDTRVSMREITEQTLLRLARRIHASNLVEVLTSNGETKENAEAFAISINAIHD